MKDCTRIPTACYSERCTFQGSYMLCGKQAMHKAGEEILDDDPNPIRHNLTAYVCCEHFAAMFGPTSHA